MLRLAASQLHSFEESRGDCLRALGSVQAQGSLAGDNLAITVAMFFPSLMVAKSLV